MRTVRRDDVITKIGDLDVSKLSYEDVLRQIVKSKRPVAYDSQDIIRPSCVDQRRI